MTGLTKTPSALELFRQFKYGFRDRVQFSPLDVLDRRSGNFYFEPKTTEKFSIPDSDFGPRINLVQIGLPFTFVYDPKNTEEGRYSPFSRMIAATIWDALLTGPFARRKFYADPNTADLSYNGPQGPIRVDFSYSGDPIDGLSLKGVIAHDWKFFIPDGTPERAAIETALRFETVKERAENSKEQHRGWLTVQNETETAFREALKAAGI